MKSRENLDRYLMGVSNEELIDALARRMQKEAEAHIANGFSDPLPRLVKVYAKHAARATFICEQARFSMRVLKGHEEPQQFEQIVESLKKAMMEQNKAARWVKAAVRSA
jgi:hypothetical protein